jgi:hypothetical protein
MALLLDTSPKASYCSNRTNLSEMAREAQITNSAYLELMQDFPIIQAK